MSLGKIEGTIYQIVRSHRRVEYPVVKHIIPALSVKLERTIVPCPPHLLITNAGVHQDDLDRFLMEDTLEQEVIDLLRALDRRRKSRTQKRCTPVDVDTGDHPDAGNHCVGVPLHCRRTISCRLSSTVSPPVGPEN